MRILLARRPIYDPTHRIVGFEVRCVDSEQAASDDEVVVNALLGTGLDQIRQGHPIYLPVSPSLLTRAANLIQREHTVLLVNGDGAAQALDVCRDLKHAGYRLALDHYIGSAIEMPLLSAVDTVKIDIRAFATEELQGHARLLRQRGLQLLADGITNQTEYAACRGLGFTLFEGLHFGRTEVVERRDLSVQHLRVFRTMRMVRNLAITEHAIEQEFHADAALAYKLLRIVNSASVGAVGVRSLGHAMRLLGRDQLYLWLALLLVAPCNDQALEQEIMRAALQRARFCELLAERGSGNTLSVGSAYLVGLLSALEPYLGVTPQDCVRELELAEEPAAALVSRNGPLGELLALAVAYETGDFVRVFDHAARLHITSDTLGACYLDAITFVSRNTPEVLA